MTPVTTAPEHPHYTHFASLKESVLGFCALCRRHDLQVGIHHTRDALEVARLGLVHDPTAFRYALRALFCSTPEQQATLDALFDSFWGRRRAAIRNRVTYHNQARPPQRPPGSLVLLGIGQDRQLPDREDSRNVSGANRVEALRRTDFSKVADMDSALLDEIADRLLREMSHRLRRRMQHDRQGRIDLRRTIRTNLSHGGLLLRLKRRNRRLERYRLVVLLDVSGSMDTYSFYLLKFIWALKSHFKSIEAFLFSTKLVRITDCLDEGPLERVLASLSREADHWSSGTRIGACLQTFNERYARRVLHGRNVTIILSDGLDTGPPELLADELQRIKLRTNKLVWLNPLKGMPGYQPLARGMSAALPSLDTFASAHNLDSLLELEDLLSQV